LSGRTGRSLRRVMRTRLVHFDVLDSTQTYGEQHFDELVEDGLLTCVSADKQTAGRGTNQRKWLTTPGCSILSTFVFRFPASCSTPFVHANLANCTQVLSLATGSVLDAAVAKTTEAESGAGRVRVKWPNDLILGGCKIAGILANGRPSAEQPGRIDGVVIGIGVNVNEPIEHLSAIDRPVWPASSVLAQTGSETDVSALREQLLEGFSKYLDTFFREGIGAFRDELEGRMILKGMHVKVNSLVLEGHIPPNVTGVFHGINAQGALLVKLDSGEVRTVVSGELVPESAHAHIFAGMDFEPMFPQAWNVDAVVQQHLPDERPLQLRSPGLAVHCPVDGHLSISESQAVVSATVNRLPFWIVIAGVIPAVSDGPISGGAVLGAAGDGVLELRVVLTDPAERQCDAGVDPRLVLGALPGL